MSTVLQERARRFNDLFGVSVPVLNAPMMGVTTPAMVAAVAAVGGLGVLPGDRLTAEELRQAIRDTRALTDKPFAVNLRVPAKRENTANEKSVHEAMSELKAMLGCPTEYVPHPITPFEDLFDVVVDERIPVVSVSFGGLRRLRRVCGLGERRRKRETERRRRRGGEKERGEAKISAPTRRIALHKTSVGRKNRGRKGTLRRRLEEPRRRRTMK
jgi:NAD(P)H-dependent flavin oxidoreductase YrpB (nitropropane dioxygenase family)